MDRAAGAWPLGPAVSTMPRSFLWSRPCPAAPAPAPWGLDHPRAPDPRSATMASTRPAPAPNARLLAGALALLVAAELAVVGFAGPRASTAAVSNAVVLDLALGTTALVWWLGVRRGLRWVILLPAFLGGLGLAHLLVGDHDPVALTVLTVAAVGAGILVLALLFRAVARATHALGRATGDPLALIALEVRGKLGTGLPARLATSELAAVWFASAGWLRDVPDYGGARCFGYGKGAGALYGAALGVTLVELLVMHLLVSRWSPAAAWVLTGLAAYGVVWILADFRAVRLRPITLDDDTLTLRTGLRWTVAVPLHRIAAAARRDWRGGFGERDGDVSIAVLGQPDVVLELSEPVVARGPYGIRKRARRLGVSVDDRAALLTALDE